MRNRLRYCVIFDVDADILCDDKTIDDEFEGNWQNFLDWFYEHEPAETMMGIGSEPIAVTVISRYDDKALKEGK